jgi:hypothetical protein
MRKLQTRESLCLDYLPDNAGEAWLKLNGGSPKTGGVGYNMDIRYDSGKVSTRQKRENMEAIRLRPTAERNKPRTG